MRGDVVSVGLECTKGRRAVVFLWLIVGLVWLYFWLRGNWFAALVPALALALMWWVVPERGRGSYPEWWVTLICLAGPWVPMLAWSVQRRLTGPVGGGFGIATDQDEEFPFHAQSGAAHPEPKRLA